MRSHSTARTYGPRPGTPGTTNSPRSANAGYGSVAGPGNLEAMFLRLQGAAGNASVSAWVQRQEGSAETSPLGLGSFALNIVNPKLWGGGINPAWLKDDATIVGELMAVLRPVVTTPFGVKEQWPAVAKQLKAPKTDAKKEPKALYAAEMVDLLGSLRPESRSRVSDLLFDALVQSVSGGEQTKASVEAEFLGLSARMKSNIEGGVAGFVAVRGGILGAFGTFERAADYYAGLTSGKFLGSSTLVHLEMADRLARAEKKLDLLDPKKLIPRTLRSFGGFNIRENRNKPTALSDHSFGFAVDVDAELNPNVKNAQEKDKEKDQPLIFDMVRELTGEDVFVGSSGQKQGKNIAEGTAAQIIPEVERLREISRDFTGIFADEKALQNGMFEYVRSRATQVDEDITGESLFQIIDGVVTGKGPRAAWRTWLADKLFPVQGPPLPPPGSTASTPPVSGKTTSPAKAAASAKAVTPAPATNARGLAVVDTLFWMHSTYGASIGKGGARVAPSAIGSRGTVAAHGFLNLDPTIVAALSGSDGGGLKWLGGVHGGTKDFMHFQLAEPPTIERAEGIKTP